MFETKIQEDALKFKIEAEHKALLIKINKIFKLAIEKNLKTGFALFVEFSGHVDSLSLRICKSKEAYNEIVFYDERLAIDKPKPRGLYEAESYCGEMMSRNIKADVWLKELKKLK